MDEGSRKKILYVSPHLSTGGLPQYLWKKIESFHSEADLYCVEYMYLGDAYVVQRNKISNLLGDRFLPVFGDGDELLRIISRIDPDVIHFEELCEHFIPLEILDKIFIPDRKYLIFETCHSSMADPKSKVYRPDMFLMVSRWIDEKFKSLGVPSRILEYPIEDLKPKKCVSLFALGLDPNYKHIVNIGLFTPGKNQGEILDYAREIQRRNLPIKFHFVGNTAENFREYWGPLLETLPDNCKVWGERDDVDVFYQAADLFLFTSNFELNPLSIKEALSWKVPSLFKRLPTYMDTYDNVENVHYITDNRDLNISLILNLLDEEWK